MKRTTTKIAWTGDINDYLCLGTGRVLLPAEAVRIIRRTWRRALPGRYVYADTLDNGTRYEWAAFVDEMFSGEWIVVRTRPEVTQ